MESERVLHEHKHYHFIPLNEITNFKLALPDYDALEILKIELQK